MENATWLSPIVIPKKNRKLKICIKCRKLNVPTKKDPYPLPFIDEMLNTIVGYEAYSFLDGYSRCHQISIAPKDRYKITFVTNWGAFIWKVMSFGPPIYQKDITKAFKEYLDNFMKIFLDDFIMYSDMENHLQKFKLCFQKCKEYGISLNPNKCAFMVFSGMILSCIVSKEGKLLEPKKIQSIINMPPPKNPQHIQVFNRMAQFYRCFIKKFIANMAPITRLTKKTKTFLWTKEC
jgi:hypothetical protein